MTGLAATAVSKRYGGVHALRDVNLSIPERAIVGLIGPNGAGKSTLLKSLAGFVLPDAGRIMLGETDLTGLNPSRIARSRLVTTFQHATPIAGLGVLDNVLVGMTEKHTGGLLAALFGTPGYRASERAQRERARGLLRSFGLEQLAGLDAGGLSFGQLRLLEIARAVAAEPLVLLLDEPAAGLNRLEIDRMTEAIRSLRDEHGMSVLVVDHDVPFVFGISDRITAMNFGRVIAEGTPDEIEANEAVRSAYLSLDGENS
ncbi:ABC transporter ATP-binding protein [Actinoplanes sp. NPDC049265]|uniref:ABC transporter ATP-binding protein n=1 Tax=Actinoplanes sp. NPDC049265 TaxID=3363902 RepID=UPI0037239358